VRRSRDPVALHRSMLVPSVLQTAGCSLAALWLPCLALLAALASPAQGQGKLELPAPRGMVNDFAQVIPPEQVARIEALTRAVRAASRGEIAVVTLADIGTRAPGDVALQIGREWKVGADAAIGDKARNAGVVLLLVPKETSSDGKGHVFISTGQGAEGFLTDAQTGDIRREAIPLLQKKDYGTAIELMTQRIAERYAAEFGFSVDSISRIPPQRQMVTEEDGGGRIPPVAMLILFVVIVLIASRGRNGGCLWFLLSAASNSGRGGGGFGGFGGGGGGGGGFGGFGGGGGFPGGAAGGDW
jgi:uncharacterized protein